jgi:hypothetical protein
VLKKLKSKSSLRFHSTLARQTFSMKKVLLLVPVIIMLWSCAPREYSLSSWQQKPPVIDGRPSEWMIPLRFYDVNTKLQYIVSNDRKNLYICLRSADDKTTANIMQYGLQLYIDTTGHHKKTAGIRFPLSHSERSADKEGGEAKHSRKRLMQENPQMDLFGFKQPYNGYVSVNSDVQVAIGADSLGILTYEAVIPFRTFYHDSLCGKDSLARISIGLVVNEVVRVSNYSGGGGGRGGHHGGGGGMRGGGMGAGGMGGMGGGGMRSGGGGGGSSSSMNDKKMWCTMRLRTR